MASGIEQVAALNEKLAKLRDHFKDVLKDLKRRRKAEKQAGASSRRKRGPANYDPARDGLPPWVYDSLMRLTPGAGSGASPATGPIPPGGFLPTPEDGG